MRQADTLTKEYLSNNEIFADVFNYLIYDGQQRILPENLIERDTFFHPHAAPTRGQNPPCALSIR